MGSLFSDFTNMSTSYSPNDFQYKYSCGCSSSNIESTSPNKPYEIIKNNKLIDYFWHQGDSIDLIFEVSGDITMQPTDNYLNVGDIAKELIFESFLYDFRGAKILEYSNNSLSQKKLIVDTPENSDIIEVIMSIDAETSSKLAKGVYKLDLIASHPSGYRETIFSSTQKDNNEDIIFEIR